jgi:hypothetical protein
MKPPELMPFIVFSTLSIFVPVMLGLIYRSGRVFRRTALAGLLVILSMMVGPHVVPIAGHLEAYGLAGAFALFAFAVGFQITSTSSDYVPAGIYLSIALPIAFVGAFVLAQVLAYLIGLHGTSA